MTPDQLLRQAILAGEECLAGASNYIFINESFPHNFENCIRLAELMAKNFDTSTKLSSMNKLCNSIDRLSESLEKNK